MSWLRAMIISLLRQVDLKIPMSVGCLQPHESRGSPILESGSKSALESRRVTGDPDATRPLDEQEILVEDLGLDSEEDM